MTPNRKYFLEPEMLDILEKEFSVEALVSKYTSEMSGKKDNERDEIAQRVFGTYGKNLAKRILEIEGKYRDRVGEIIYEVAEKTGHLFPSAPQRLLEISFLGPRSDDEWNYKEISHKKIIHLVTHCSIYEALKDSMGEKEANLLPCRYADIATSSGIYEGLNLNVLFKMTGEMPKEGFCRFSALFVASE